MIWHPSSPGGCAECGTTERPHKAKGLCVNCYGRTRYKLPGKPGKWSKKYDRCRECKTQVVPHKGHGFCQVCYNMGYYNDNAEAIIARVAKYKKANRAKFAEYTKRHRVKKFGKNTYPMYPVGSAVKFLDVFGKEEYGVILDKPYRSTKDGKWYIKLLVDQRIKIIRTRLIIRKRRKVTA